MVPIRFACPSCQSTVTAPPEQAGSRARCPRCKLPMEIPWPRGVRMEDRQPAERVTATAPRSAADPFSFEQLTDDEDYRPRRRNRGNGTAALVWALLGLFLFTPLGIVAIMVANQALREDPNDGNAKAGLIIGWVDTALFVSACCFLGGFLLLVMGSAGAAGVP